jgi:glycosyltransferase involved in cell wall biosynthesis
MIHQSDLPIVRCRYLLVCPIPYFEDGNGDIWIDELWHHDLMEHLSYLSELRVAATRRSWANQPNLRKIDFPTEGSLAFIPLPDPKSRVRALLYLPMTFCVIVRAVSWAEIVHSGVVGWPFPFGLIANPLAVLLGKPLIMVIESSPWRLGEGTKSSLFRRMQARFVERFARWSIRKARLSIFTSTAYRDSLVTSGKGQTMVTPATWINEEDILSAEAAVEAWKEKSDDRRFIFAGRLTQEKGVLVLLDALSELDRRGVRLKLDLIGEGPLEKQCKQALAALTNVASQHLPPQPYGKPFFEWIRGYSGVIIPSLSDEQPRIVFDAYSQAVPVVASDTSGHRDCVRHAQTGVLFKVGDASALVEALMRTETDPGQLRDLGLSARAEALEYTHKAMHATRAAELARLCQTARGTSVVQDSAGS